MMHLLDQQGQLTYDTTNDKLETCMMEVPLEEVTKLVQEIQSANINALLIVLLTTAKIADGAM